MSFVLGLLISVSVLTTEVALLVESAKKLFDTKIAVNREPTQIADVITSHRGRLISTSTYLLLPCRPSVLLRILSSGLFKDDRCS